MTVHADAQQMTMPESERRYACPSCGRTYGLAEPRWACDCGGPLDLTPGPGLRPGGIDTNIASLWRYRRTLTPAVPALSLGEGWTPLVKGRWEGRPVEWKLDYLMPSGSFKDRGIAMMASYLAQAGVTAVHEDSSGNGGASLALYAAALGISCRILVPATTSPGKIVQIAASGAEPVLVEGSRDDVARKAREADDGTFYASHNWQAHFLEGLKTLGFELWEQSDFAVPDCIVAPTGSGSVLLGCAKAFAELRAAGSLDRSPRLYAAQAANCAPLHRAFKDGSDPVLSESKATIAEGIATARPVRGPAVLAAIRASGGTVVAASEDEIGAATLALARQGLFVEPTSAAAAAGLTRLLEAGAIAPGERVVVVLTGSGLKAVTRIGDLLERAGPHGGSIPGRRA
jgi:threonine synthase